MPKNHIKEVVLHVGLQKTGTSSIQNTLYNEDNNKLLLREGILYPRCWGPNHSTLGGAFHTEPEKLRANKFPKVLSKEEIKNKDRLKLERFETELNNSLANRLIISGEGICITSRKGLKNMRNYLMEIGLRQAIFKIIFYTRNPVMWTGSYLQEKIKYGSQFKKTFNNLGKEVIPTLFQERIGKFIDIFGEEAIHVHSFEKARTHNMGMVGHFLEELKVEKSVIQNLKQIRKNESVSMFTGEFLSYINDRIPLIIGGKHNTKRHKNDHRPLINVKGNKFDIPLEEKKTLASVAEQDIVWLKKNYHIEYSNEKIKEEEKYKDLDSTFEDIEKVYPILTKTLRAALLDFMENKMISEIPSSKKNQCMELVTRFKKWESELVRIDQQEERLQSKLNIKETDKGSIYREIALFVEAYDQLDAAKLFMRRASLYRPNDDLIKKKNQEYCGQYNVAYNR